MSRLNFCPLEPLSPSPTIAADLLYFLTDITNASLTSGCEPSVFESVSPTKPSSDPSDIHYRPLSSLSSAVFGNSCM